MTITHTIRKIQYDNRTYLVHVTDADDTKASIVWLSQMPHNVYTRKYYNIHQFPQHIQDKLDDVRTNHSINEYDLLLIERTNKYQFAASSIPRVALEKATLPEIQHIARHIIATLRNEQDENERAWRFTQTLLYELVDALAETNASN